MANQQLTYETKCRICGEITNWFYSKGTSTNWPGFIEKVSSRIQYARQYRCDKCNKDTVQDVVSYTSSI